MNNKKLVLSMLGIGILSSVAMLNTVDVSAWGSNNSDSSLNKSRVDWNSWDNNRRPINGIFKSGQAMPKNPSISNGGMVSTYRKDSHKLDGNNSVYVKDNTQKLRTAIQTNYNFDILYYEPYADSSGTYSSQGANVDENYYTVMSSTLIPEYKKYYKNPPWQYGSNTNFSLLDSAPNYAGKAFGANQLKWSSSDNYDKYVKANGQWRYIGYNQMGNPIGNPFFPADGYGRPSHASDAGIWNQDIHKVWNSSYPAHKESKYSPYDEGSFYELKLQAIERLLKYDPNFAKGTIAQKNKNGGYRKVTDGGNIPVELWANALSLVTDPKSETPLFEGHRLNNITSGGLKYVEIVAPTDPKLVSDLSVKKIVLKDSKGNVLRKFERNGDNYETTGTGSVVPGNTVKVEYTIQNTGKRPTTINPSVITGGYAINSNALQNDYNNKYNYNAKNVTVTSGTGILQPGKTATMSTTFVVPDDAWNAYRVTGYIHQKYIDAKENGPSNNDWGHIVAQVEHGDLSITKVRLQDRKGNYVTDSSAMKPGEDYRIVYTVKYEGPNRERATDIKVDSSITRWLPDGGKEVRHNYTVSKNDVKLTDGATYNLYNNEYITFEIPRVSVTGTVSSPNISMNSITKNDTISKDWFYDYDIKVSNVQVYNNNERPTQNGTITLGVKYDIDVVAPSKTPYFETDIKTNITLPNGQVVQFTDHVVKGSNKNITREVKVPVQVIMSGSKKLNIKVHANADKKFWENDLSTQANNKGSATAVQLPPYNPTKSVGCSLEKTSNTWNVSHSVRKYSGDIKRYSKFDNSRSYYFYKYGTSSSSTQNKSYEESYKIKSVKFKSKDTVDNKYGTNGWVDLMTTERAKAFVKAGYGYELQIEVEYKTNALSSQPKLSDVRNDYSSRGTSVTKLNTPANIYKDIYVRTNDGKTLSATGMYGSIPAFDVSVVKSDATTTVLRYTMKNTTQNGVSTPMKIYTNENLKDGKQNLTVWTPTITGAGNVDKSGNLCSDESLVFSIKGSMYDDNQESIIQ